jgi:hypothetical protein
MHVVETVEAEEAVVVVVEAAESRHLEVAFAIVVDRIVAKMMVVVGDVAPVPIDTTPAVMQVIFGCFSKTTHVRVGELVISPRLLESFLTDQQ